jgi:hypothetical protein
LYRLSLIQLHEASCHSFLTYSTPLHKEGPEYENYWGSTIIACVLLLIAVGSSAQDTTSSGKSKAAFRTFTGCLAKGDSANEFVLNSKDGSTWNLNSDQVSLAEHVGHTVTVKGVISNVTMHNMKEEAKDAAAGAGVKKENSEHGDMQVASLKMVSGSCK